jgi:hypothetical protein
LKKEGQLVADTKQKANILNEQFKSVFTTESIDNTSSNTITHHHNTWHPIILQLIQVREIGL